MFVGADTMTGQLKQAAATLEPGTVAPGDAVVAVEQLSRLVKVAQALITLLAARVALTPEATRTPGGPGAYLARALGITTADGRRILDASLAIGDHPGVRERLVNGDLSPLQAAAVIEGIKAAEEAERRRRIRDLERHLNNQQPAAPAEPQPEPEPSEPGPGPVSPEEVEQRLLDVANSNGLGRLRDEAEREKAATRDPDAQAEHQHRTRYWRRRTYTDGSRGGEYKLPPHLAAQLESLIHNEARRIFNDARRQGRHEAHDAYCADALTRLLLGDDPHTEPDADGTEPAPAGVVRPVVQRRCDLIVRVDLAALLRGVVDSGEVCEIPGLGPVPLTTARALLGDALLNVVIHDGVDVRTVVCGGRRASKALTIALNERQPFCVDCGAAFTLETDHDTRWSQGGATTYDNLKRRCHRCHQEKTRTEARNEPPP